MSTPDKDKVEECDKCTRLAIHTFTKRDHEAFSLDWVCYLKLEMKPWDGPKFFLSVTFEKAWKIIHVGYIILKFHVPRHDFFFKVLQIFISYESAKDKNLRAFFSRVQNASSCNIFNQIVL